MLSTTGPSESLPGAGQAARSRSTVGFSQQLNPLAAQLVDELAAAWHAGEQIAVEEMLARHDATGADSEVAIPLIYEELCQREENGQVVDRADLLRRFPQWKSHLEMLLDCDRLLACYPLTVDYPKPGDRFGEFCLVTELGRGAAGRVFLATQPTLSDRPVVLKITPGGGHEHLSLARLQHSGIVPLYLIQEFPERGVRAMCMPYLGGLTLARALELLEVKPPHRRCGQDLVALLEQARETNPEALPLHGPAWQFLERASYMQAVCWIGASLADALHYAHERGLLHLDVKPSNVLLASDGQPMLLDFHLAREAIGGAASQLEWIGGTQGYMSPEQQAALEAVRAGRVPDSPVDRRADIFALGVLLCEMLGFHPMDGDAPWLPSLLDSPCQLTDPEVVRVIKRCLHSDPHQRYPDAEMLARDLRRCLVEPRRRSRIQAQSRSPASLRWLSGLGIWTIVWTCIVLAVVGYSGRVQQARIATLHAREYLQNHAYLEAVDTLRGGLDGISWLPGNRHLKQQLQDQLNSAARAKAAQELRIVVDHLRFLDGPRVSASDQLRAIESMCGRIWDQRDALVSRPSVTPTPVEDPIRTDLLDLAILWTDLRVRLASAHKSDEIRREGLSVLEEAGRLFGLSPALCREVQSYANVLGLNKVAEDYARRGAKLQPTTAWGHYSLGRSLLRTGELGQASDEFQKAVDLAPDAFWPNFYWGICSHRLHRPDDAVAAFGACVAIEPKQAECFYDRAVANVALGRADRAQRDFERAKQLDPSLLPPTQ
ncbi:MAG: protein kinase domain-containing protein [Pirellulaceae bacterium]